MPFTVKYTLYSALSDALKNAYNVVKKEVFDVLPKVQYCVAGGYIRKLVADEYWIQNDIDVYCKEKEFSELREFLLKNNYVVEKEYPTNCLLVAKDKKFDLVLVQDSISKVIEDFDFTVCRCAMYSGDFLIISDGNFEDHIKERRLEYIGSCNSSKLLKRVYKYASYGYRVMDDSMFDRMTEDIILRKIKRLSTDLRAAPTVETTSPGSVGIKMELDHIMDDVKPLV